MAKSILPVVKSTPCIAGIGAHDPSVDFDSIIKRLEEYGFSGVNNEPFSGLYGKYFSEQLERAGVGFSREVELIKAAHKNNFFSVAWAMSNEEAARMAAAGADVIGAMIGVTSGGMSGASKTISLEEATDAVRQMIYAAKRENPDVMVLPRADSLAYRIDDCNHHNGDTDDNDDLGRDLCQHFQHRQNHIHDGKQNRTPSLQNVAIFLNKLRDLVHCGKFYGFQCFHKIIHRLLIIVGRFSCLYKRSVVVAVRPVAFRKPCVRQRLHDDVLLCRRAACRA